MRISFNHPVAQIGDYNTVHRGVRKINRNEQNSLYYNIISICFVLFYGSCRFLGILFLTKQIEQEQ
jgi:hypothetical protein